MHSAAANSSATRDQGSVPARGTPITPRIMDHGASIIVHQRQKAFCAKHG
jgi:hypothetical protein